LYITMSERQVPSSGRGGRDRVADRGRVIVADDDVLFREGLASLLTRQGFDVVGKADDGAELLELVRRHMPDLDLVIVDIRMPPRGATEGLEAARTIRASYASVAILVLSGYVEVNRAMDLLASGDRIGYLLKSRVTDVAELTETLERISKGDSVIDPSLVHELFAAHRRQDPLAALSRREHEVLELMAEGLSNTGIAQKLWVTEGTVEKHVHGVLAKLHVSDTGSGHRRVLAVLAFLDARRRDLP
jgi:DNA-binding NarL/FixJ family response regulator